MKSGVFTGLESRATCKGLCESKTTNIHCGDQQQAGMSCGTYMIRQFV